jgi:hypothetical protein
MSQQETARLSGEPIPNVVLTGNSELKVEILRFHASLDDDLWAVGWCDDARGPFESRRFAEAVSGVCSHAPA